MRASAWFNYGTMLVIGCALASAGVTIGDPEFWFVSVAAAARWLG